MACKAEAKKVRLECPLCLDNFKDATLLNCGHTFCKGCLEGYGEQRNNIDRLTCPVCRKSTKLGPNRVKGLTPNFAVKVVEDKINVDVGGHKASYCSLHSTVYKDIFCLKCGIFICLTCYLDTHKDHKIIKKEEMGRNLRDRRDALIKKSRTRITKFEKCLNVAAQEDKDMHCHLNNMKKNIKDEFARKMEILQKNEELLLKRVDGIQKDSDEQFKRYMDHHRQLIGNINSGMTLLTDNTSESYNSDTLQAFHQQYREIENFLKQTIDNEYTWMVHLKQAAKTMLFCPMDEHLLALGIIEQGVKATTGRMQRAETATCVGQNEEELQSSSKVAEIPTSITPALKIVRKFELPGEMTGMAALSQDAVVIGYGHNRDGADCFYVSGDKKPHLGREVGRVNDIAVLSDGRSVVSQNCDSLQVFDKRGEQIKGMRYTVMDGRFFSPQLCHDKHDNIYAVNTRPFMSDILIFHGKSTKLQKVVNTGDFEPEQICVTKTGIMITNTCFETPNTVNVFDREGHEGTMITANYDDEYLCAAVDSQDRVLVARGREGSDTLGLTRYKLQGLTLTEEVKFKQLKLHEPCKDKWCYMISLKPNMIAFACEETSRLYFIEIDA